MKLSASLVMQSACMVVVCMFSAKIVVCCYNVGGVGANVILHLVMSTWIIATL